MSFLTKVMATGSVPAGPARLTGILVDCPAVAEYLTVDRYPDGSPRERATLSLFMEDGVVKACLSDRDQGRTLWRSSYGVEEAIMALDGAIADGTADWRRAAGSRPPGRAKK